MGSNIAAGNQQKHLPLRFAIKDGEFISRGTQKHQNNTFSSKFFTGKNCEVV